MQETLDKLERLAIELCEKLPQGMTIFEEGGFCQNPNACCDYCIKISDDTSFCYKKTYTPTSMGQLEFA